MKLLLTGWAGVAFAEIAAHTVPLMSRYAARHGLAFACENMRGPRPTSWQKVPLLLDALGQFDAVVWIDADVVIVNHDESIFDAMPGHAWQGLVEHATECGVVPNCGVWVVTQAMRPVLDQVMRMEHFLHHPWWEQAALLEQMGFRLEPGPRATLATPTRLHQHTAFLPSEWNHHPHDARRVERPRFLHVTQYPDRLAEVKRHAH